MRNEQLSEEDPLYRPAPPPPVALTSPMVIASSLGQNKRSAAKTLSKPSELTRRELASAIGLITRLCGCRAKGDAAVVTKSVFNNVWDAVFRDWDSSTKKNEFPVLGPRKAKDINMLVGEFSENLPLAGQGKRKRGEPPSLQSAPERRKGAPAYLGLTLSLDDDIINWYWTDSKGSYANPSLIKLTDAKQVAYHHCITNYDTREIERVLAHNRAVVVTALRRRVVRWAVVGAKEDESLTSSATNMARTLSLSSWRLIVSPPCKKFGMSSGPNTRATLAEESTSDSKPSIQFASLVNIAATRPNSVFLTGRFQRETSRHNCRRTLGDRDLKWWSARRVLGSRGTFFVGHSWRGMG